MAQLAERLLPIQEVRGLNPGLNRQNFIMNLFTDQNKDKRPGLANFYTKMHCLQSQFALGEHFILNDQKDMGKCLDRLTLKTYTFKEH